MDSIGNKPHLKWLLGLCTVVAQYSQVGFLFSIHTEIKGKGIPYVNNPGRRGDLVFKVNVEIPRGLNEKQKEYMRAFAESCGENNYSKRTSFFKRKK